jgi:hypothetical protein
MVHTDSTMSHSTASMYHLLVSAEKYIVGFKGRQLVRAKPTINNQIIEQVNSF